MTKNEATTTASKMIDLGGAPGDWSEYNGNLFRCQVYLTPEEDGGFSAVAATLPGIASEGDTEKEAMEAIREALEAAITEYLSAGETVPWLSTPRDASPGSLTRWVFARVG